jgi:hypothetical protein
MALGWNWQCGARALAGHADARTPRLYVRKPWLNAKSNATAATVRCVRRDRV